MATATATANWLALFTSRKPPRPARHFTGRKLAPGMERQTRQMLLTPRMGTR